MQMPRALEPVKRLVSQISDDEVPDLAAGLAYRFLFAIFPFAIFLAALAGFIAPMLGMGDVTSKIVGSLADNLPPDVAQQLRPQLETVLGVSRPGLLSIGAVTALWAATGGINAVIKGMNKAYDVEETRSFLAKTGIALALTFVGSLGIIVAFVTIVGGSVITQQAASSLGLGDTAWTVVSLARYPLVLLLVALAVAVLFKFGPNVSVSFRWTFVGGLVFAVGWLVGTVVFGLYVANFSNYANTYGALGGVIVLLLWFYLTGLLLLVAAEVTSLLVKSKEPHKVEARRQALKGSAAKKVGEAAGRAIGTVEAAMGDTKPPRADGDRGSTERGRSGDGARGAALGAGAPDSRDAGGRWDGTPRRARDREAGLPGARSAGAGPGVAGGHPALAPSLPPAEKRRQRLFGAAVVGIGAAVGALLGRIAGDDDQGAAST